MTRIVINRAFSSSGSVFPCVFLSVLAFFLACEAASAAGPRVLPAGQVPADSRLEPLLDLNGYFPFQPPGGHDVQVDRHLWEQRADRVRRQIAVAMGLWPMPQETPLNATIHGRIEQPDYTIDKVYFESFPGFYVTGNLYRPKTPKKKMPGVLCPHGHWSQGRFYDCGETAVKKLIDEGAEQFADGGRSPLQSRCVQLARMGCVVFHYDMIGYADSLQISFEVAHRFAKQRPEMNRSENWGLFSPQAESHLQSVMGLQAYNSIRALDFLESLSDVDPNRLAVTGASGGGTQTFILSALDPRIRVSFPAVMVSTAMQGGCTCENASLLRVGTGNVEFAALFAPKPQGLTAADDWTKEMETKGFPELQQLYGLLGAKDHVHLFPNIQFPHNYNHVSRAAMYQLFNEHLELELPAPVVEREYERLSSEQLTVWDDDHPKPTGGDSFERSLLQQWNQDSDSQLKTLRPTDAAGLRRYREIVGGAVEVIVGRQAADIENLSFNRTVDKELDTYRLIGGLLRGESDQEELPFVILEPHRQHKRVVLWLSETGKDGLFDDAGDPMPAVQSLLAAGIAVAGVDLLYQGEFLPDGKPFLTTPRVGNPREAAAYTFGYNRAVFAQRVHDVLTAAYFLRNRSPEVTLVDLAALDGSGRWAAAALAQAGETIQNAAIDSGGFRFAAVDEIHSPDFLPGGAKYFDLPGMLALAAPRPLWLAGEGAAAPPVVLEAYHAADASKSLVYCSDKAEVRVQNALAWLTDRP